MTLADLPGYGFAVATADEMKAWKKMCRSYLKEREILVRLIYSYLLLHFDLMGAFVRCCVLVDCTRGLCKADIRLLKYLNKVISAYIYEKSKLQLLLLHYYCYY